MFGPKQTFRLFMLRIHESKNSAFSVTGRFPDLLARCFQRQSPLWDRRLRLAAPAACQQQPDRGGWNLIRPVTENTAQPPQLVC
jgi:hypothetical protein